MALRQTKTTTTRLAKILTNPSSIASGLCATLLMLCAACTDNVIYDASDPIPAHGWEAYDRHSFPIVIPADGTYDIDLFLRHDNEYRYRNIWLFVDYTTPDSTQATDTVNCVLADTYGRWYGSGWSTHQYLQRLKTAIPLDSGSYEIRIAQGMRERNLQGISTIGLRISRHTDK